MAQQRTELGRMIERGLREAIAYERGRLKGVRVNRRPITAREVQVEPPPEYTAERVRRVRFAMGLSQSVFASALNVSDSTIRAWEQGKRAPDGPSLRLLELAEREPESFLRTIRSSRKPVSRRLNAARKSDRGETRGKKAGGEK